MATCVGKGISITITILFFFVGCQKEDCDFVENSSSTTNDGITRICYHGIMDYAWWYLDDELQTTNTEHNTQDRTACITVPESTEGILSFMGFNGNCSFAENISLSNSAVMSTTQQPATTPTSATTSTVMISTQSTVTPIPPTATGSHKIAIIVCTVIAVIIVAAIVIIIVLVVLCVVGRKVIKQQNRERNCSFDSPKVEIMERVEKPSFSEDPLSNQTGPDEEIYQPSCSHEDDTKEVTIRAKTLPQSSVHRSSEGAGTSDTVSTAMCGSGVCSILRPFSCPLGDQEVKGGDQLQVP